MTLASIEVPIEEGSRFGIVAVDEEAARHRLPGEAVLTRVDSRDAAARARVDGHLRVRYRRDGEGARGGCGERRESPRLRQEHHSRRSIRGGRVFSYPFYDENKKAAKYWRDIGTLDAYYEANMDLCHVNPEFNLYDPEWPLRTYQPQAPPAKFVFAEDLRRGEALDSLISPGCIVSGSRIWGSILCPNVRVHSFCNIEQSILMPGVRVGRHAQVRNAIVDRDVLIPRGAHIGFNVDEDRRRHTVTEDGVVVVTVDEEPFIGAISDAALRQEAEADLRE